VEAASELLALESIQSLLSEYPVIEQHVTHSLDAKFVSFVWGRKFSYGKHFSFLRFDQRDPVSAVTSGPAG
jgi:hypothetical protein